MASLAAFLALTLSVLPLPPSADAAAPASTPLALAFAKLDPAQAAALEQQLPAHLQERLHRMDAGPMHLRPVSLPERHALSTAPAIQPRIVGGSEAADGAFPFFAAITINVGGGFGGLCGGTLIDPEWVLTAAHCVLDEAEDAYAPGQFTVTVGSNQNPHSNPDTEATDLAVDGVIPFPGFSFFTMDGDAALLHLASPAFVPMEALGARSFTPGGVLVGGASGTILPAADPVALTPGTLLTVIGVGTTSEVGDMADALQEVEVPVVDQDACNLAYEGGITDNMFCAGDEEAGGIDSCQGDSGGFIGAWDGTAWVQAGIVSFGNGCGQPGFPGVYTRLANLAGWVEETITSWAGGLPVLYPPIAGGKAMVPIQVFSDPPVLETPIRFAASGEWRLYNKTNLLSGDVAGKPILASGKWKSDASGAATVPVPIGKLTDPAYGLRVTIPAQGQMQAGTFDTLVDLNTMRETALDAWLRGSVYATPGKATLCAELRMAGHFLAGQSLTFTLGGLKPAKAKTNAHGEACATISGILPGVHAVRVNFTGDAKSRLLPATFSGEVEARGPYQEFTPGNGPGFYIDSVSFKAGVPQASLALASDTGPLAAGTIQWTVGEATGTAQVKNGVAQLALKGVALGEPMNDLVVVLKKNAKQFIAEDIELGTQSFSTELVMPFVDANLQSAPISGALAIQGSFWSDKNFLPIPDLPFTAVVVPHGSDVEDPATPVLAKVAGKTNRFGAFEAKLPALKGDGTHLDLYLLTKESAGANVATMVAVPGGVPCSMLASLVDTCPADGWEDFDWVPQTALTFFMPLGGVVDATGKLASTFVVLDQYTLSPVANAKFTWTLEGEAKAMGASPSMAGSGKTGKDGTATIALGAREVGDYSLSIDFPADPKLMLAHAVVDDTLHVEPFVPGLAFAPPMPVPGVGVAGLLAVLGLALLALRRRA